jgi:hypothetical protein
MSKSKKIFIICLILIIGISSTAGGMYYFNKIQPYNSCMRDAATAMNSDSFDKAIALYGQALKYKNDPDINTKIELAKILKTSKDNYDSAVKQMNGKKYLESIDLFKKVDKQDNKRYKDSQNKIQECKKQYIAQNINNANDSLKNSKFNDANNYLSNIFKLDATNTDALKVKNDIAKAIQKQKDKETTKAIASTSSSYPSGELSKDDALKILNSKIINANSYCKVTFFFIDNKTINGEKYYQTQLMFQNTRKGADNSWHMVFIDTNDVDAMWYINAKSRKIFRIVNNNLVLSEGTIKSQYNSGINYIN